MNRLVLVMLFTLAVFGCGQAELTTAAAVDADRQAFMDDLVRLEGTHVERNRNVVFVTTGLLNYIVLEDSSGRIRVWYDVSRRRCPPRIGARLAVEGKVVAAGPNESHIFVAKSMSIDDEPPLPDDQIRMCQLSFEEQQIEAEYGSEGLQDYWRETGKPIRTLVYD